MTLELHNATSPYALASTVIRPILKDGTITSSYFNIIGQSYYIVIKHRNGIETWSANPVTMTTNLTYDFRSAATQAYGSNQVLVDAPGMPFTMVISIRMALLTDWITMPGKWIIIRLQAGIWQRTSMAMG
ncbi:MAG: hypothetical protein HWD58_10985 [Bacteroidota bacterium]|nr:MAG: hypothetical protein HWD58_10985 [Bacteroidota bacterium]